MRTNPVPTSYYEPIAYMAEALLRVHEEAEDDSDIREYMSHTENEEESEWKLYGNY